MEWQERLRRVDASMAAGEITVDEQRRLRDEILAEASGSGPPRMAAGPHWQAVPTAAPPLHAQYPSAPTARREVFVAQDKPRRTWVAALVLLVVLAVAAAVVWWVAAREDSVPAAAPPPELGVERLPNPVETPLSTVGEFSVAEGVEHKLLNEREAAVLEEAGTREVNLRTATAGPLTYQLFLFETGGQNDAGRLRSGFVGLGEESGMAEAEVSGLPSGVTAARVSNDEVALMQAVYATEGGVVRIVIIQSGDADQADLAAAMSATVASTTAELPVRTS